MLHPDEAMSWDLTNLIPPLQFMYGGVEGRGRAKRPKGCNTVRPQSDQRTTCLCIVGNINIAIYARFNRPPPKSGIAPLPFRFPSSLTRPRIRQRGSTLQVHSPQGASRVLTFNYAIYTSASGTKSRTILRGWRNIGTKMQESQTEEMKVKE